MLPKGPGLATGDVGSNPVGPRNNFLYPAQYFACNMLNKRQLNGTTKITMCHFILHRELKARRSL